VVYSPSNNAVCKTDITLKMVVGRPLFWGGGRAYLHRLSWFQGGQSKQPGSFETAPAKASDKTSCTTGLPFWRPGEVGKSTAMWGNKQVQVVPLVFEGKIIPHVPWSTAWICPSTFSEIRLMTFNNMDHTRTNMNLSQWHMNCLILGGWPIS